MWSSCTTKYNGYKGQEKIQVCLMQRLKPGMDPQSGVIQGTCFYFENMYVCTLTVSILEMDLTLNLKDLEPIKFPTFTSLLTF